MTFENASWFDWVWLAIGVGTLLFTSLNTTEAWWDYLRSKAINDVWMRHVAGAEFLQSIGVTIVGALITIVGACALFIPSPSPETAISPLSLIAGIALLSTAFIVFLIALVDWVSRRTGPRGIFRRHK